MTNKFVKRKIRHRRVRNKIRGTLQIPRLSVFRSNKHIFAQIIDDSKSKTLASTSDLKMKGKWAKGENNNLEKAFEVGLNLAKVTQKKNIKKVVFDRNGYNYHGRIKSLAEGARKGGLVF